MKVSIRDADALRAVSPAALTAYVRAAGWRRSEPYGEHSDVYDGEALPEIIVPRTAHLGDYGQRRGDTGREPSRRSPIRTN